MLNVIKFKLMNFTLLQTPLYDISENKLSEAIAERESQGMLFVCLTDAKDNTNFPIDSDQPIFAIMNFIVHEMGEA